MMKMPHGRVLTPDELHDGEAASLCKRADGEGTSSCEGAGGPGW